MSALLAIVGTLALCIALIIFCYWFAFRRYTRLQVINNQWINK